MNLLSDALRKEIEDIVDNRSNKLAKEEIMEIVKEIMPQLEEAVKKEVTRYFKHMANIIIFDRAFKED
jgi:uncharacterized protein YdhG (YjbR/CyaY superfamily)